MNHSGARTMWTPFVLYGVLLSCCWLSTSAWSQTQQQTDHPVVVSAQMRRGAVVYKLNGRIVENSRQNSLLKNLANVLDTRGELVMVFLVIDVHAPFSEMGKLETALDKIGLTQRRFFVSDFSDGLMQEIHFDEKAIPIPPN
jgi:hypothetical protein